MLISTRLNNTPPCSLPARLRSCGSGLRATCATPSSSACTRQPSNWLKALWVRPSGRAISVSSTVWRWRTTRPWRYCSVLRPRFPCAVRYFADAVPSQACAAGTVDFLARRVAHAHRQAYAFARDVDFHDLDLDHIAGFHGFTRVLDEFSDSAEICTRPS